MYYYSVPRVYLPRPDRLYLNLRIGQQHTEVDLTMLKEILAEYEFELIKTPQLLSGGQRSHSLILFTSNGKKMLKRYKSSLSRSTIIQEHSILTYLTYVGFPSPRLVATPTGKTLVREGEHNYALFDFVEVKHWYVRANTIMRYLTLLKVDFNIITIFYFQDRFDNL
jgi:hypothetical protein